MLYSKSPQLQIQLAEDEVYLRGEANDGSSALAKGILKLTLPNAIQTSHLILTLTGTVRSSWTSEGRISRDRVQVLYREWEFLPQTQKHEFPHAITSGVHHFPFQAVLDRSLPSSLDTKNGKVEYKFTASLGTGYWRNMTTEKLIKLTRVELPSSSIVTDGIYAAGKYDELFSYQVSSPNKAFGPNDDINLKFNVAALKVYPKFQIYSVSCLIKRKINLISRTGESIKRKDTVLGIEQHHTPLQCKSVDTTLTLSSFQAKSGWLAKLPAINSKTFLPDTDNPLCKIQHHVKARIAFTDDLGRMCDLIIKFDIRMMPLDRDQLFIGLPTYGNRNTLLLEADQLPPNYRSTWCPLATQPSLSSLPDYDHPPRAKPVLWQPTPNHYQTVV